MYWDRHTSARWPVLSSVVPGAVGIMDIVASLRWVRQNIERSGGDPNLVTIFGQSGGGRKVATLMAMPSAKGLFHRAIIESGAVLRLTAQEDAIGQTNLLLRELGLERSQARELQNVRIDKLLAANAEVQKEVKLKEPGGSASTIWQSGRRLLFADTRDGGPSDYDWWVASLNAGTVVKTGAFGMFRERRLSGPVLPFVMASANAIVFSAHSGCDWIHTRTSHCQNNSFRAN
jgi:carboxylesterase family protein